jgi:hypothetical protein
MIIFKILFWDIFTALIHGIHRPATWLVIIIVLIGSHVVAPHVSRLVPLLLGVDGLSTEINLLQYEPEKSMSPISGAKKWIQIDITSATWCTLILPALFVVLASGMPKWRGMVFCSANLILSWFALLETKLFFMREVAIADGVALISAFFAYIALGAATISVCVFGVSAAQRKAGIWGVVAAIAVTVGAGLMMRFLDSSPYLNETIVFFATISIVGMMAHVRHLGEREDQELETIGPLLGSMTQSGSARHYLAFISYRRESGAEAARLISKELRDRGINAFLDVDDMASGHFDERLLRVIETSQNFIVILTSDCLVQCNTEDDWLRIEIEHAIKTARNIIPILKDGFDFPPKSELPPTIAELEKYNGVRYDHVMFTATIERLISFLKR